MEKLSSAFYSKKLNQSFNLEELIDYQNKIEAGNYFIALNDEAPRVVIFFETFDVDKLFQILKEKYNPESNMIWLYREYDKKEEKNKISNFVFLVRKDFMIQYDQNDSELRLLYSAEVKEEEIQDFTDTVKVCIEKPKADSKIFLLYENQESLCLKDFEVKKNHIDIRENYNDDFEAIHELIVKRLNTENDKGLVLLYGIPGTGKTSYIRYLTSLINKRLIYIPPEYAHKIASPSFLPLLISNPNSVLIIEDAEGIVEARENGRNASVSNLLNLADGLLSDCLNIQIICTFNTHISNIDKALLRKGRLIATYEFKALELEKAQKLSDKLGFKSKIKNPLSLSDIYNQDEMEFNHTSHLKIGFK